MEHSSPDMTVEQICTVIDLLNPCIDDHLYVYDFTNDYYYISPHAAERFPIPGTAFHNVIENHRHFVYAPDLAALQTDLNDLIAGRKKIFTICSTAGLIKKGSLYGLTAVDILYMKRMFRTI